MPPRETQLVNGEFYHLVKRGNDKRKIFLCEEDYFRFANSLLIFNSQESSLSRDSIFQQKGDSYLWHKPKNPLVKIYAFALMENHFHLLLCQLVENGIVAFIRKLGGYSYFFNKKHERTGSLFEGRYKIKLIETDAQLKNNFVYIHSNPVELVEPRWKDSLVNNPQGAIQFLENKYRWSSYWDYLGKQNFPSLTSREFFLELFDGKEEIKKEIDSWILFKASNVSANSTGNKQENRQENKQSEFVDFLE